MQIEVNATGIGQGVTSKLLRRRVPGTDDDPGPMSQRRRLQLGQPGVLRLKYLVQLLHQLPSLLTFKEFLMMSLT